MRSFLAVLAAWVLSIAPPATAVSGAAGSGQPDRFRVLVSAGVSTSNVTLADIARLVLGGQRFWPDGSRVVVLLPPAGSKARRFLFERVLHMNEQGYRRYTLGQIYRGELDYAPKVVASDEESLAILSTCRGVVAIVPASMAPTGGARALTVDGLVPGATNYPLEY